MDSPTLPSTESPDHASEIAHHGIRHRDSMTHERDESPDHASDSEQQAESTRKLIQVYSVSAPLEHQKEKKKARRAWKTGSKRLDVLLQGPTFQKTRALRYRTRALWLLALYLPLLVVPWILTCTLSRRPAMAPSYVNQQGFSKADMASMRNWKRAVDVLNSIAGLITIPLLSALLAQGAVVFSQRQRPEQFLSLPDLFALVDRGWTSIAALWSSLKTKEKKEIGRKPKLARHFLLPGAALILLGAIQQPLFQILVPTETVYVATCEDLGYVSTCQGRRPGWYPITDPKGTFSSIGMDIEPAQMADIYYQDVLPRIASDLESISVDVDQPSIWSDYMTERMEGYMGSMSTGTGFTPLRDWVFPPIFFSDLGAPRRDASRFFVAGIPTNTTTGILREHAMRMNTSVLCSTIEKGSFPVSCPGEEPFTASSEVTEDISVRICVPGKLGIFPWTLSRNRQDITEELYLDMWDTARNRGGEGDGEDANATVRCEVKTTRGYFELGNLRNKGTYGSLLEKWPGAEVMARDFNDLVSHHLDAFVPTESDDFVGDSLRPAPMAGQDIPSMYWKASGPLALSAEALFGNISWFNNVVKYSANVSVSRDRNWTSTGDVQSTWYRMCAGMPFGTLIGLHGGRWNFRASESCKLSLDNQMFFGTRPRRSDLPDLRRQWLKQFAPISGDMERLTAMLQISTFVANQALLNHYAPTVSRLVLGGGNFRGRTVYTSPGFPVLKPTVTIPVLTGMSILIGLQLLGLLYLTWYIYHVPSWTGALDAMAMAHIGARLGEQDILPSGMSGDRGRDTCTLHEIDGLIGVVHLEERQDGSDTELQQLRRVSVEE